MWMFASMHLGAVHMIYCLSFICNSLINEPLDRLTLPAGYEAYNKYTEYRCFTVICFTYKSN